MSGSCLIQLAALVVAFKDPLSTANFTNESLSGNLSSLLLQFKTSQSNTRIAGMNYNGKMFGIDIQNGLLHMAYNLIDTGKGSKQISSQLVNTSEWFVLNITSQPNNTSIRLTNSNNATSFPCTPRDNVALNFTLLGPGFSALFKKAGITFGGKTSNPSLKPFEGCIGAVRLAHHPLVFFDDESPRERPSYFTRNTSLLSEGCPCVSNPCNSGAYVWDEAKGICICKCPSGYQPDSNCRSRTPTPKPSDDDVDAEFIYLVVGVTLGVLVLVSCLICCIVYCRRTSSSTFGVYNPKDQEEVHGQQLNTAFTLPVPEKLI